MIRAFFDSRPTKSSRVNLGQLAEIDPTSHSTTLPWAVWVEFTRSLELFGSIDEKGEYFELYDDSSDLFPFSVLPSLEIAIPLSDGSSHFVLAFTYKDFLAPTTKESRFRLLVNGGEETGDRVLLGNSILNKWAILFDSKHRQIAFGESKNYVHALDLFGKRFFSLAF